MPRITRDTVWIGSIPLSNTNPTTIGALSRSLYNRAGRLWTAGGSGLHSEVAEGVWAPLIASSVLMINTTPTATTAEITPGMVVQLVNTTLNRSQYFTRTTNYTINTGVTGAGGLHTGASFPSGLYGVWGIAVNESSPLEFMVGNLITIPPLPAGYAWLSQKPVSFLRSNVAGTGFRITRNTLTPHSITVDYSHIHQTVNSTVVTSDLYPLTVANSLTFVTSTIVPLYVPPQASSYQIAYRSNPSSTLPRIYFASGTGATQITEGNVMNSNTNDAYIGVLPVDFDVIGTTCATRKTTIASDGVFQFGVYSFTVLV
jgi:hypothetical protein